MSIICLGRSIDYTVFEEKSWQEKMINSDIMCASPDPSELPMPPQKWLKKTPLYDLSLLDWATEQAIEVHWKNQVKACQYAIFHIC